MDKKDITVEMTKYLELNNSKELLQSKPIGAFI